MKTSYSSPRSRISVHWIRCFAFGFILAGFGGMNFAAKATSENLNLIESKVKVTLKSDRTSEKTEQRSDRSSEQKAVEQASIQKSSQVEPPKAVSWLKPAPSIPKFNRATVAKQNTAQAPAITKEAFLKTQQPGSARQLLAESPTETSPIAQASENVDSLRQQLTIDPLTELRIPAYSPGSTVGVPSAFGANFGDAFVGLAFSNRRPRLNESDGALSVGFGLGDSERSLGLEVNANIGSLKRFGQNGDVGLKLHRALPGKAAIAIGLDEGIIWGEANENTVSTFYGVASKIFDLRPEDQIHSLPLTLTLGIGGGRFRSFENIQNRQGGVGVFASAGLRVVPQASVIASWTGQDLNLGVSYVPLKTTPLFLTFVVGNVLNRNDSDTLFSFGIGYGFNYAGYRY